MKMYNVIIVDDEPFVRLAIKSLANWEEYGFSFIYEASNGKEALRIFNEKKDIDIFIIDMNMPVMHGLEIIENLKINHPEIPVIVLSGYNDYNFVRKAFKLGIIDYILKIEMTKNKILELLNEAVKAKTVKNTEKDQTKMISKDILLREIISSENNDLSENVLNIFPELNLRLYPNNIRLCFLWVDDFKKIREKYKDNSLDMFGKSIVTAVSQVLDAMKCGEIINISPQEYLIFLSFITKDRNISKTKDVINSIKYSLKNYLNIEISAGISTFSENYSALKKQFKEAEKSAGYRHIAGKGTIIFYDDLQKINDDNKKNILLNSENIFSFLKNHEYENAKAEFDKILIDLSNFKPDSIDKIYDIHLRLIFILINYLSEIGENPEDIYEPDISFHEEITRYETIAEINSWVKNISDRFFEYLSSKRKNYYSRAILISLKYIKENYCSPDLNLSVVSKYVELSKAHFSYLFNKETGVNFLEYLTKLRIEEAKRLLKETSMKVYEVSLHTGYDNVEHFSRIFKKITGISPIHFNKN
jgi:two-component system, response regulator YesN